MRSAKCQISSTAGTLAETCDDVGGGAKPLSKLVLAAQEARGEGNMGWRIDRGTPVCYQGIGGLTASMLEDANARKRERVKRLKTRPVITEGGPGRPNRHEWISE